MGSLKNPTRSDSKLRVSRMVRISKELSREVATVKETHEMLKMPVR